MKKSILVLLVCLFAIKSYSQAPTLLGTHGSNNPSVTANLGAQVVRYGFADYKIKNVFSSGGGIAALNKMMAFDSLGIEQVVFLRWPDDTIEEIGVNFERIPSGADSVEVFQYLDTFLMAAGPYIDWIQISQEPLGVTKYNDTIYTVSEVLQWWRTVAQFIRSKQGHLKIMTGGITGIKGVLPNDSNPLIDSIIKFGENYCDAIDVHLHTSSLTDGIAEVAYITNRTNHPLTCTEWSQSRAAVETETGWLNDTNTVWMDSSNLYFGLTNKEVIDSAYVTPMDTLEWNAFIATSPYTTNFIPDFYKVLDSNCFIMACYGGVFQYGNPRFDWKQLIANMTVTASLYPNNPFYTEYIDLSSFLNSGSYNTNCSATTVIENVITNKFVYLYPNPASTYVLMEFENLKKEKHTLILYNSSGQLIRQIDNISNKQVRIERGNLTNGLYFFQLQTDSKIIGSGKLIME